MVPRRGRNPQNKVRIKRVTVGKRLGTQTKNALVFGAGLGRRSAPEGPSRAACVVDGELATWSVELGNERQRAGTKAKPHYPWTLPVRPSLRGEVYFGVEEGGGGHGGRCFGTWRGESGVERRGVEILSVPKKYLETSLGYPRSIPGAPLGYPRI